MRLSGQTASIIRATCLVLVVVLGGCVVESSTSSLERNRDPVRAVGKYVAAGMIYLQQGDMKNAHLKLNRAHEINPDDPNLNNALALFYTVEGDPKLVEEHYRKAVDTDPGFSQARNNYASFLFGQRRFEDAVIQLEAVAKDYRYNKRSQSFESMGLCYLELGRREEAKKAFARAIQLNNRQVVSWQKLAEIAFSEKNYQQTQEYLSKLEKISHPTSAQIWLGIQLQRILGDKDKLSSLELALKNLFPASKEYLAYKETIDQQ